MKKGFTLIELLVVIAIIGALSSIVISSLAKARESSKITETTSNLKKMRDAIESYYAEFGVYPDARSSFNAKGGCWGGPTGESWMPELIASGYAKLPLPQAIGWTGSCSAPMFLYYSNGKDYKIFSPHDIYAVPTSAKYPSLKDPVRPTYSIGFWSEGGRSF